MGLPFYDLDEMFEEKYHYTIWDFFKKFGEKEFRKFEQKLLWSTASFENAIISTGGGTPCFFDNMDFINKNGISVYLQLPGKAIANRLRSSRKPRPMLQEFGQDDFQSRIMELLETREKFYLKAHLSVDQINTDVDTLFTLINEWEAKPASGRSSDTNLSASPL